MHLLLRKVAECTRQVTKEEIQEVYCRRALAWSANDLLCSADGKNLTHSRTFLAERRTDYIIYITSQFFLLNSSNEVTECRVRVDWHCVQYGQILCTEIIRHFSFFRQCSTLVLHTANDTQCLLYKNVWWLKNCHSLCGSKYIANEQSVN